MQKGDACKAIAASKEFLTPALLILSKTTGRPSFKLQHPATPGNLQEGAFSILPNKDAPCILTVP